MKTYLYMTNYFNFWILEGASKHPNTSIKKGEEPHENQLQRIYALKLPVILPTFTSERLNKIWAAQAATWAPRLKPTI